MEQIDDVGKFVVELGRMIDEFHAIEWNGIQL